MTKIRFSNYNFEKVIASRYERQSGFHHNMYPSIQQYVMCMHNKYSKHDVR